LDQAGEVNLKDWTLIEPESRKIFNAGPMFGKAPIVNIHPGLDLNRSAIPDETPNLSMKSLRFP